jgi:hypothetical protein
MIMKSSVYNNNNDRGVFRIAKFLLEEYQHHLLMCTILIVMMIYNILFYETIIKNYYMQISS